MKLPKCSHDTCRWIEYENNVHLQCCECRCIFDIQTDPNKYDKNEFKPDDSLHQLSRITIAREICEEYLSKEQLWYLANVYPEALSKDEARKEFKSYTLGHYVDKSYWTVAAKIANEIINKIKID